MDRERIGPKSRDRAEDGISAFGPHEAEEVLAAQQRKPQGARPDPARGSVEWEDRQKSRNGSS